MRYIAFLVIAAIFVACNDEESLPYPSIVTEMADCLTNGEGVMYRMVLDNDTALDITNRQSNLKPNATYRCLAGFTQTDGKATLYSLRSCPLLHDSTLVAVKDPVAVVSLWKSSRYLNLHLLPKGQQFKHDWGYATDSVIGRHTYITLHHRQGDDPLSYSADVYASLPLNSLATDSLTLRILTFEGLRQWTFAL